MLLTKKKITFMIDYHIARMKCIFLNDILGTLIFQKDINPSMSIKAI